MDILNERLQQLDTLLTAKKKTAALLLPGSRETAVQAADGCKKIRIPDKKMRPLHPSIIKTFGLVSRQAAIVQAMQARNTAATDWGAAVTDPALLPTPLTGNLSEDGQTDISTVYIAVTDGKRAAVQQLSCPGDLSDGQLREAMMTRAVQQSADLLTGLLQKEKEALTLFDHVSRFRRYAVSPTEALLRSILPWRGDKPADIITKTVLIAAVVAVILAAGMKVSEQQNLASHTADNIRQAVEVYTELPTEEENSSLPDGYQSKFASLYAINPDVTGWLTVPGTNIDLPIMQADDNDYYLSHDLYGKSDPYGLPYIDYRVPIEPDGQWAANTIVYGSSIQDGCIFDALTGYRDEEFYKEHPFLTLDTVYNQSEWVIFAAFDTAADDIVELSGLIQAAPDVVQRYMGQATARSYFTNPVDISTDDVFLTLLTCSGSAADTRLCVAARRLREGESEQDFDFSCSASNPQRVKSIYNS